jgi:hypothetical protein
LGAVSLGERLHGRDLFGTECPGPTTRRVFTLCDRRRLGWARVSLPAKFRLTSADAAVPRPGHRYPGAGRRRQAGVYGSFPVASGMGPRPGRAGSAPDRAGLDDGEALPTRACRSARRTHRARTRHARTPGENPARPGRLLRFPVPVACGSVLSRREADLSDTGRGALLMRLGGNTLRGSNPRSSALTSSFARALRLGGLLLFAFRGLCVATAAIRPPIYLIRYPRCRAGPATPGVRAGSGSMVLAPGSNADRRAWSTIRRQPRA